MAEAAAPKKLTIFDLQAKVDRGEKIFQVTAVDYPTAQLVDRSGVDCILIGDSLGMTALGYSGTVPVTMDEMIHHAKAISRAAKRSLLVGDLPLGAYHASTADAINNAMRMLKEGGTDVVKIEGGEDFAPMAEAVVKAGVPVMAHIGLTPQLVSKLGGFKVQGKSAETGVQLLKDALAMEKAGCFAIVLEAIPDRVAQVITEKLKIPKVITRLLPKLATSQPVIGVTTAVARILKVMAQAISSWVADMAPCICGSMVEVVSSAVEYSDEPSTTAARIR